MAWPYAEILYGMSAEMWRSDIGNSARFYTHEFQYGSDFNNGQLKIMRVSVKWDEIEEVGRNKKPYVSNLTIL